MEAEMNRGDNPISTEDFKRQLDELRTIIWEGVACFWAWRGLLVMDEESAKGLNRYTAFFYPARESLRRVTLLQFAKVFDRDRRAVSLRNLLGKAMGDRQNLCPRATDEELTQLVVQIDKNEPLLNRLKGVRDQRIAHHDAIRATDASRLMPDEIQKLLILEQRVKPAQPERCRPG
jgi:hypothetical protein